MIKILPDADGRLMITAPMPVQFAWTYMSGLLEVIEKPDCPEALLHLKDPDNLSIVKEQVRMLRDRAEHSLRRLKSKGYYAETIDDIYDKLDHEFDSVTSARARLHILSLNPNDDRMVHNLAFTDDQWYMAIEQTIFRNHFDLYTDIEAKFTPALWDCIPDLYMNLLSIAYGRALLDTVDHMKLQQATMEPIMADCQKIMKETQAVIKQKDELQSIVERQKAIIEEYRAADAKTDRARDKEILALQRRVRELESTPDETREPEEKEPVPVSPEPESEPQDLSSTLHELPEKDVIFVGGDWNLQKRLKALYPGWQLIGTDDKNFPAKTGIRAIFIWSNQMGHATMARLNRMYDSSVPRLYATKTNMDSLVQEMTEVWSDWVERNTNADC